jgi:flagellar L-ring protein precursor FlgH
MKTFQTTKHFAKISGVAVALAFLFLAGAVHADSLYPLDSTYGSGTPSLYSDVHALRIGDPVTIVISESVTGSVTSSSKANTTGSDAVGGMGPSANIAKTYGLNDTNSSSSDGQTSHTGSMTATMTAIVTAVYANGTFKIQGNRNVTNNGVSEQMTFSGIIRKQDIASDNTVQSKNVANAQIIYIGKGEKKKQKLFGLFSF